MHITRRLGLMLTAALLLGQASAAELTRDQALRGLGQADGSARLTAVQRLGQVGAMADTERLAPLLADTDAAVGEAAEAALWGIWSRSGDAEVDQLLERGVQQIQALALDQALGTFDLVVRRKPDFAEGWNKRATVYFLLGRHAESLQDCDEVLKRNRHHFGALSGAAQIHLKQGRVERALDFFRRALEVNPNLRGAQQMIPLLEEHLRDKARRSV